MKINLLPNCYDLYNHDDYYLAEWTTVRSIRKFTSTPYVTTYCDNGTYWDSLARDLLDCDDSSPLVVYPTVPFKVYPKRAPRVRKVYSTTGPVRYTYRAPPSKKIGYDSPVYARYLLAITARSNFPRSFIRSVSSGDSRYMNSARYLRSKRPLNRISLDRDSPVPDLIAHSVFVPQADFKSYIPAPFASTLASLGNLNHRHFGVLFQCYYLAHNIASSDTAIDVALHAVNFFQHYPETFTTDSLTATCMAAYALLPKIVSSRPRTFVTPFGATMYRDDPVEHVPQAENPVLHWIETIWNDYSPSRTATLCALASFLLCLYFKQTSGAIMDFSDISTRLQSAFADLTSFSTWWEFFHAANGYVLDGYSCWQKSTLIPFLTASDYSSFCKRVAVLRISQPLYGAMEAGPRIKYTSELYALIDLGEVIKNRLRLTSAVTAVTVFGKWFPSYSGEGALSRDIETLLSLKLALEADLRSARSRRAPLGILITGASSIGKTIISDFMFRYYGAINELPQGSEYKYAMNGSSANEFMSGYNPSKWAVALDDIGAIKSDFQKDGDPMCRLLIDAINNVSFVTNQADLGSKGTIPFVASVVIATSNTKDFGALSLFNTPQAVLRRLEFVVSPVLTPYYSDGGALHKEHAFAWTNANPDTFPPFWKFKVELVKTVTVPHDSSGRPSTLTKGYRYEEVSPPGGFDVPSFLEYYKKHVILHSAHQDTVVSSLNRGSITICSHGNPSCVTCLECDAILDASSSNLPQSDDLPDGASWTTMDLPTYNTIYAAACYMGRIVFVLNVLCVSIFTTIILCRETVFAYFERQRAHTFMRRWTAITNETRDKMIIASASLATGVVALRLYYTMTRVSNVPHADVAPTRYEDFGAWDAGYVPAPTIRHGFPAAANSAGSTAHTGSVDAKLMSAVKRLTITKDPINNPGAPPSYCHGLMVGSKILLLNTHSLTNCAPVIRIKVSGRPNQHPGAMGTTNAIEGAVPQRARFEIVGTPYTIVNLSFSGSYKDLVPYFLTSDAQPGHSVEHWRWLTREVDNTTVMSREVSNGSKAFEWCTTPPLPAVSYPSWAATGNTHVSPFVFGHSGSLWLSKLSDGRRAIIGLHEGISRTTNGSTSVELPQSVPLFAHVLRDAITALHLNCVSSPTLSIPQNLEVATALSVEPPTAPFLGPKCVKAAVHSKFAGNYLHLNGPEESAPSYQYDLLHGSVGHRARFVTSFSDSIMRDYWENLGYETDKVPPCLAPGAKWKPEANYFKAATTGRSSLLDPDMLRDCADSFLAHIRDTLPDEELALLEPYNLSVAMNGAEGIRYVDPLNMSTGTGHGYTGVKRDLFNPTNPTADAACEMFYERVDHIEKEWRNGRLVSPIYTACLKDEPISVAKQIAGKVRVFLMSPVDATVAARIYLLPYCRVAQRNPFVFEQAVGMNCHSAGWGNIARYLHTMGGDHRQIAGDYKQFDCALQAALLDEVRRYFLCLFAASGKYSPGDLMAASCALADIINPTVDYFGTFVGLHGLNPTGNMLTVHVNGVGNSILLRYAFGVLGQNQPIPVSVFDYRKHVSNITYGDDHVCGVATTAPWYNQNTIAATFNDVGIGYTDANKRESFPDYEDWGDVCFLKRRFIWSDEISDYLAPLEENVFGKMLCLARRKNINEYDGAAASLLAFVYEKFHHGRCAYDNARDNAISCTHQLGLPVFDYPSFDSRIARFDVTSSTLHYYSRDDFISFRVPHTKIPCVGDVQLDAEGYDTTEPGNQ